MVKFVTAICDDPDADNGPFLLNFESGSEESSDERLTAGVTGAAISPDPDAPPDAAAASPMSALAEPSALVTILSRALRGDMVLSLAGPCEGRILLREEPRLLLISFCDSREALFFFRSSSIATISYCMA